MPMSPATMCCTSVCCSGRPPSRIYTLSLHDALPISEHRDEHHHGHRELPLCLPQRRDRKSTRLNSSHRCSSYAVFCLKKKIVRLGRLKKFSSLTLKVL